MEINKNDLLQWHTDAGKWLERMLFIDPVSRDAVFLRIEEGTSPFWRTADEILDAITAREFHVLDPGKDPYLRCPVGRSTLDDKQLEEWDKTWKAIQTLHEKPQNGIFGTRRQRKGLIQQLAKTIGRHRTRIYPLLWKFWAGGQTPQCLLRREDPIRNNKRAFKGGAKRGRKSALEQKLGKSIGILITPEIEADLLNGIKKYHTKQGGNSLEDAYSLTMAEYFNAGYECIDGIEVPVLKHRNELPTLSQFLFVYYKHKNPADETKGRKGENSFELTGRAITGNSETSVMGPGQVAQIDWTTADIYLRSDYDPSLIVGRPVIYAMIDVWGRFFYSVIVTFEQGGYWPAVITLENALLDKVEYCAQYGVTIESDEWPVQFLPEKLVADGGELSARKTAHIVESMGIGIATLPPRRGDLKGIVERCFGRFNGQLVAWLPGAFSPRRNATEEPSPLDAVLTVGQFRQLVIKAILRYHRQILKRYRPTADLIKAGIKYTPIELLKWGIKNRSGRLLRFPLDQARLHLLPGGEATVTPEGIRFNKLFFTCNRAVDEGWFETARSQRNYKILVAYDPRKCDTIYLRGPRTKTLEPMTLVESCSAFQGWTWAEIKEYQKRKMEEAEENRTQELQDKVDLQIAVQRVTKAAEATLKQMSREQPPASKATQTSSVKSNHADFCHEERVGSVQQLKDDESPIEDQPAQDKILELPRPTEPPAPGVSDHVGVQSAMRKKLERLRQTNRMQQ